MAIEFTGYDYGIGLRGDVTSKSTLVCDDSEWQSAVNTLLGAASAVFPNLLCNRVRVSALKGDPATGKRELTAEFVSRFQVESLQADEPFRWRIEDHVEAVTIRGAFHWGDDEPLDSAQVSPTMNVTMARLVLYGTRSSFDLGSYDAILGLVNSDVVLGAAAETLLCDAVSVEQRQLLDGTIVYGVELALKWRKTNWNMFYRESTGLFEYLYRDGGSDKVYEAASMAGLLT